MIQQEHYNSYLLNYLKQANGDEAKALENMKKDFGDGFDEVYAKEMLSLCTKADYVLPNITEACFMTDTEYKETYDREYVDLLIKKLTDAGCKNIIFTKNPKCL